MTEKLDQVYTADEAAERLRISKRAVIKIARMSGHCARVGRDYLFSEADLLAIWQDIREPPVERRTTSRITPVPTSFDNMVERLKWLSDRPPINVDRRAFKVLKWLEKQDKPKTYVEIDNCGPRTIEYLLQNDMVVSRGTTADGLEQVLIAPLGKDQLRTCERWKRKRATDGRKTFGW